MTVATDVAPKHDANRLGLDYRAEAARLPWRGPIHDVHTHINSVEAARLFFEVADVLGIQRVWTMTQLENVDALKAEFGDRLQFIAVPNYSANRDNPAVWTSDWLKRIELFRAKGCRIVKLWSAPRGRDFTDQLRLDSATVQQAVKLARELDMMFMTHVADPDTWFATKYADSAKYGTKMQQYEPLERLLDDHGDVPWIAAHMAGDPEHLDHLQELLDRHANLYLDCSATKWMVRELSKQPAAFADFCKRNAGRVLFGSDIVANTADMSFDLFASRWWALRTLIETDYDGPSPIVDPDLSLVDPTLPKESTALLRGAKMTPAVMKELYADAAERLLGAWVD
jgi:predicted TIM-barrel fold metal-dependent hydrolase